MRRLTPADNRPPALGNFVRFSQNPEQLGESGENSKSTCRFTRACYATVAKLIGAEGSPLKQRRACLLTKLRTLESLFRGILILHSFFKAKHGLGVHWSGPVYFPTQFVCIPTPTWILTITDFRRRCSEYCRYCIRAWTNWQLRDYVDSIGFWRLLAKRSSPKKCPLLQSSHLWVQFWLGQSLYIWEPFVKRQAAARTLDQTPCSSD